MFFAVFIPGSEMLSQKGEWKAYSARMIFENRRVSLSSKNGGYPQSLQRRDNHRTFSSTACKSFTCEFWIHFGWLQHLCAVTFCSWLQNLSVLIIQSFWFHKSGGSFSANTQTLRLMGIVIYNTNPQSQLNEKFGLKIFYKTHNIHKWVGTIFLELIDWLSSTVCLDYLWTVT